jgi:signal transduction histidine kinase/CheY-like chemotaxis protein
LSKESDADRLGVWIEPRPGPEEKVAFPPSFVGMVWERGREVTPSEWAKLSPEFVLPQELFIGKSVEQDLDGSTPELLLGPLMEMRRAIWVAVAGCGHLRGILLAGTRTKHGSLPRALLESVAAELWLALELDEKQRVTRERQADLAMAREMMAAPNKNLQGESSLALLVNNCTETSGQGSGLGAAFAAIGRRAFLHDKEADATEIAFPWKGGDPTWTRAVENEPLRGLWKSALEARRLVGRGMLSSWPRGEVGRVLALPLENEGEILGVLVAGLRPGAASLATLERLELRALLAAAALAREKRCSEDARREAWQRSLFDSAQEAILLNARGEIAALSRGARDLLKEPGDAGTDISEKTGNPFPSEAEILGASFAKLFQTREREGIEGWARRILAGASGGSAPAEESPEYELRNRVRVRLRLVMPAEEELYVVLLDPVRARDTESRPERAETELSNVLEWLEEGVVLFDAQDDIRAMNSRFTQMAGLPPAETAEIASLDGLIGRLAGQTAEPHRFAERWRELSRSLESGVCEELQLVRPAPRILERAARPVLDAAGRRLGRLEVYRDLTARRVFQSKLLQTEKLASLGQMVTGVAHELSNPLTSILGYAQRLLLRDTAERTEEAQKIYQEAERASTILRQLLLNVRETQSERCTVSLNQVVLRTMELQRFGLAAEMIRLELELDPAPPFVHGDAGQLQQVLMNLVGNARQAIEESGKGGTVRVRTKRVAERRVLLEVSDDGPGIPEAVVARIFDPFFTTKPAGMGTGLGLAIVLGIVREHGGQLRVASPPSGGAIFTIELPAASEAAASSSRPAEAGEGRAPESRARRAGEPQRAGAQSGKARPLVLVVEDEPTVARLIADVLKDEGMRVEVLLDGRAALHRAEREHYDLVVCDMKMPGLDGQNFYKTLMRRGNSLRERFLFVTGDVVAVGTQEFLEQYHVPHVAKPFRVEELAEKAKQVLAGKIPREAVSAARPAAGTKRKAARNG